MKTTRVLVAASLIAMSGLLVSCSSPGVADKREAGVPDGLELAGLTEGPIVIAYEDGSVDVVTYGSGSCPPTVTTIKIDGDELLVTFDLPKQSVCTADLAPTTHSFSSATVGGNVPDSARVIFPEADEEVEVDVIRE